MLNTMTTGAVRLRLLELRKARGLTQAQLAQKSGLNKMTISRLEGTPRQIEFETLDKLSEALGVEMSELFVSESSEAKGA